MRKIYIIGLFFVLLGVLSCEEERPVITYLRVQNIDDEYTLDEISMENAGRTYTITDLKPGEVSGFEYFEKAVNNTHFTILIDGTVIEKNHYYIDPSIEALLASGHYTYKIDIIDLENQEVRIELFKN